MVRLARRQGQDRARMERERGAVSGREAARRDGPLAREKARNTHTQRMKLALAWRQTEALTLNDV